MKINLRLLYLYLFCFIGLLIVVFGSIQLVNLGLNALVFKDADKYEFYVQPKIDGKPIETEEEIKLRQERELVRQRQRELSNSIAMITVGLPLYLYHWKTIQKEHK